MARRKNRPKAPVLRDASGLLEQIQLLEYGADCPDYAIEFALWIAHKFAPPQNAHAKQFAGMLRINQEVATLYEKGLTLLFEEALLDAFVTGTVGAFFRQVATAFERGPFNPTDKDMVWLARVLLIREWEGKGDQQLSRRQLQDLLQKSGVPAKWLQLKRWLEYLKQEHIVSDFHRTILAGNCPP
jgi:hypothetical protein